MVGKDLPVVVTGVTVIWASPRFGQPHSQKPSDMGILCNPNPISLGFGEWGCPYHCDSGFYQGEI